MIFDTKAPWAAFTFGALILPITNLVNASHGTVIGNYFSMREYKLLAPKLSAASAVGSMVTGSVVPVLLVVFKKIILLELSIGLVIFLPCSSIGCVRRLRHQFLNLRCRVVNSYNIRYFSMFFPGSLSSRSTHFNQFQYDD